MNKWDESAKEFWQKNGYILFEDVLTKTECIYIRKIVVQLAEWERRNNNAHIYDNNPSYRKNNNTSDGNLQRVWNIINKHSIFREIIQLPTILDAMEDIFMRDTVHNKYILSSFQANIVGPGGVEQKLHVDTPIPEPFPPWIMKATTVWLLDDFEENNGATLYLPGSHKFGKKPTKNDQSRSDLVQLNAKKGSVAIHHGYLWHKSGTNKTDNSRIALLGAFAASYTRDISNEENYGAVVDDDVVAESSKDLNTLIGISHGIMRGATQVPPQWDE